MTSGLQSGTELTGTSGHGPIRVLLVDDHRVVVESFSMLLQLDGSCEVVGVANSAENGVDLARDLKPDIAIFDVDFPGRDSFDVVPDLIRWNKTQQKDMKIIFLTAHLSDVFVHQATSMGARGYLLKGEPATTVIDAIRRVHEGGSPFLNRSGTD